MTDDTTLEAEVEQVLAHGRALRKSMQAPADAGDDDDVVKALFKSFRETDRAWRRKNERYQIKTFPC